MAGFSIFHRRKPRRFSYRPVWYDPVEEERRRREARAECRESSEEYHPGSRLRRIRDRRITDIPEEEREKQRQKRFGRLLLWLALALGIGYLLLKSRLPEHLVQALME